MMSTVLQDFRDRVEAFLARTHMPIGKFGELACNDRAFVADMRDGQREFRLSTIEKVEAFMMEFQQGAVDNVDIPDDGPPAPPDRRVPIR